MQETVITSQAQFDSGGQGHCTDHNLVDTMNNITLGEIILLREKKGFALCP